MNPLKKWMSEDIRMKVKYGRRMNAFDVMVVSIKSDETVDRLDVFGADEWMRRMPQLADVPPLEEWKDLYLLLTRTPGIGKYWIDSEIMPGEVLINPTDMIAITWYERPSTKYAKRRDPVAYVGLRDFGDGELEMQTASYSDAVGVPPGQGPRSWEELIAWLDKKHATKDEADEYPIEIIEKKENSVLYMDWEITGASRFIVRLR